MVLCLLYFWKTYMNERVEKLAELCGFRPSPSIYDRNQSFDIEKFAKLIVQECGEVAYKAYWNNPETVRGVHIQEKIKKHFGVEE
jgi:hypothetical protein